MNNELCPYHADHDNRLKKLEQNCDELDDRVTALDKENAVNRAEITSALKNLEKLPDTMLKVNESMISMQSEIRSSTERMGGIENKLSILDKKVSQVDDDGKINIRQGFKNWFIKNWMYIGLGVLLVGLYLTELVKNMVMQ